MSSARMNARSGGHGPQRRSLTRRTSPPRRCASDNETESIRVTIPSDFVAGREVQQRILDAVDRHGFTAHSAFAIKLALEEALINAIKHGNKFAKGKNVHIEANITPSEAEIIVQDEGPGFDRTSVPDPTLVENLEKCSGRGILLIEAYMNSVEWSQKGRRLRMIKRNGEEPAGR